jgi:hypothetical protein
MRVKGLGGWLPSLTASDATTWTVDSQINLPYKLDGFNEAVCVAAKLDQQPDRYGFSKWLRNTLAAISRVARVENATDRTLLYDSNFGVTTSGGGGVSGVLVFVPVSANASLSRNDVQHLRVTVASKSANPPTTAPGGGAGAGTAYISSVKDLMNVKSPPAMDISRVPPAQ